MWSTFEEMTFTLFEEEKKNTSRLTMVIRPKEKYDNVNERKTIDDNNIDNDNVDVLQKFTLPKKPKGIPYVTSTFSHPLPPP